ARAAPAAGRPQHRPFVHRSRTGHLDLLRRALPAGGGRLPPDRRSDRSHRRGRRRTHRDQCHLPGRAGRMTFLIGALLGAGLLLCASPWLWPARERAPRAAERGRLRRLLEESGHSRSSVRTLVVIMFAIGLVAASLAWLVTALSLIALLAGISGAAAPVLYLRGRRLRLRKARRQPWPDVCDLLVAAIRVGL